MPYVRKEYFIIYINSAYHLQSSISSLLRQVNMFAFEMFAEYLLRNARIRYKFITASVLRRWVGLDTYFPI